MCPAQERAAAEGGGPRRLGLRDGTEGLHGFAWGSVVVGGPLDEGSEVDQRLACGAAIACRLRGAVREQLGAWLRRIHFLLAVRHQSLHPSQLVHVYKLFTCRCTGHNLISDAPWAVCS